MREGRLQQLVIHPGQLDVTKSLRGVAWALTNSQRAKLISLRLHLISKDPNPQFRRRLLKALQSGGGCLSEVTALHVGLEDGHHPPVDGPGQRQLVWLAECQRWLSQRMPNLEVLSLEARVCVSLSALKSLKHLALSVRWQPSLLKMLESVSPTLETLCLQKYDSEQEWGVQLDAYARFSWPKDDSVPLHLGRFQSLKLLALHDMAPADIKGLPEGCRLCVRQGELPLQEPASRIVGAALGFWPPHYETAIQADKLKHAEELSLAPISPYNFCLRLDPMSMHAAKTLTTLRVLVPLSQFKCVDLEAGAIEVTLPASLRLRSLALVAPVVRLGFEDPHASAACMQDLKVISAEFEALCEQQAFIPACHGLRYLQEEVAPHLPARLSLATCQVNRGKFDDLGQQAVSCVYTREQGGAEKLPAELLRNRCLCHACYECLQTDGKPPGLCA